MIKQVKIMLFLLNLILIVSVVITLMGINSALHDNKQELSNLYARKEDLMSQQQQLKQKIARLNNTLEQEISNNQELEIELARLRDTPVQTITRVVKVPAPEPVVVAPTPVRRTVTRAS